MNVNEALEYMSLDDCFNHVHEKGCRTGSYCKSGDTILFGCVGEYPCCHYDMAVEEFLREFKDREFEKDI
jgi:hypothetical protein